ncbi:O-methyltransferase [Laceyella tengchongensis]|uniref:O-methyltransferase n=1 Tax=Laceyella tengchongensis TaxID=574699 RepID=UPI0012B6D099|nr:hypothetical protein [Laceyella tengchongensis]
MRDLTYIRELFAKEDEVLKSIPNGLAERGMPQISIPPEVGRTLYLLAKISGTTRILELGTLGGYSTIYRFDFFFIDADKPNFDHYLEKAISLAAPNAVIAMDNLLYFGDSVLDETNDNPILAKLRQVNQTLAQDPRIESMLLPIGDGLGIAKVKSA